MAWLGEITLAYRDDDTGTRTFNKEAWPGDPSL